MVSFNPYLHSLLTYNRSLTDPENLQSNPFRTLNPLQIGLPNSLNLCWLNLGLKFAAATGILDTYLKVDLKELCKKRQKTCDENIAQKSKSIQEELSKALENDTTPSPSLFNMLDQISKTEEFLCQKFIEEKRAEEALLISIQNLLSEALTIIRQPKTLHFPLELQSQLLNTLQDLFNRDFSTQPVDCIEFLHMIASKFSLESDSFPVTSMEIPTENLEFNLADFSNNRKIFLNNPQALYIHLPRWHYSQEEKNISFHFINAKVLPENGIVQFKPLSLEIPTNKTCFTYKLHPFYQVSAAVVHTHDPNNAEGGHYTFIERKKNENGTYQHYWHNDRDVYEISKEGFEQLLQGATLIHLEKMPIIATSIKTVAKKTTAAAEKRLPKETPPSRINFKDIARERGQRELERRERDIKNKSLSSSYTPSSAVPDKADEIYKEKVSVIINGRVERIPTGKIYTEAELDQREQKVHRTTYLAKNIRERAWEPISRRSAASSSAGTATERSSSSTITITTKTETKQRLVQVLKPKPMHIGSTELIISQSDKNDLDKDPKALKYLQELARQNPGAKIVVGLPPLENVDSLFKNDILPDEMQNLIHGLAMEGQEALYYLKQATQSEMPNNLQLSAEELNRDDEEIRQAIATLPPNEAIVYMNLTPPAVDMAPIWSAEDANTYSSNPYQFVARAGYNLPQVKPDTSWLQEYFGERWETVNAESNNSSTVYLRPTLPIPNSSSHHKHSLSGGKKVPSKTMQKAAHSLVDEFSKMKKMAAKLGLKEKKKNVQDQLKLLEQQIQELRKQEAPPQEIYALEQQMQKYGEELIKINKQILYGRPLEID